MTDCASAFAQFLLSAEGRACETADAVRAACAERWPNLTQDEARRGFAIASETLRADGAEHYAEAETRAAAHAQRTGQSEA